MRYTQHTNLSDNDREHCRRGLSEHWHIHMPLACLIRISPKRRYRYQVSMSSILCLRLNKGLEAQHHDLSIISIDAKAEPNWNVTMDRTKPSRPIKLNAELITVVSPMKSPLTLPDSCLIPRHLSALEFGSTARMQALHRCYSNSRQTLSSERGKHRTDSI